MASQKPPHHKHPHDHQRHAGHGHHFHTQHQPERHSSSDQDSHGNQSAAEERGLRHQHHHGGKPHHHPPDHPERFHPPRGSHSHITASSSSSSFTSSSSSSSDLSESSWSSSSEERPGQKIGLLRPQYSRSCIDLSRVRRAFDTEEEDEEGHGNKPSPNQKAKLGRSGNLPAKGISKEKAGFLTVPGASVRKARSMEVLSRGREADANDDVELARKKGEARKKFVDGKIQFSSFLDEITRQVLSPSRLSSLGVTDFRPGSRPSSPNPARSPRVEHRAMDKTRLQGSRPGSGDSLASTVQSNTSSVGSQSHRHSHSGKPGEHHHHHHHQGGRASAQRRPHSPADSLTDASLVDSPTHRHHHHHHGPHHNKDHHSPAHPYHHGDLTPTPHHHHRDASHATNEPHHLPHAAHSKAHRPTSTEPLHMPSATVVNPEQTPPSYQHPSHTLPGGPAYEAHHSPLYHEGKPVPGELKSDPFSQEKQLMSSRKENTSEVDRIKTLQAQNAELHLSLVQTAERMESMGAEFKTSHQLLDSELQRTHVELGGLLDKFKRLQENYSATQQTNDLLERKLHSVSQNMDAERERLNQRIIDLTEQLIEAKGPAHHREAPNVPSQRQEADDSSNQCGVPPPPAQFMDGYGKVMMRGEDPILGPLPEESESDWSEVGDDTPHPRFTPGGGPRGHTAFSPWRRGGHWAGQGEGDTESESGGEEIFRQNRSFQMPHIQVMVRPDAMPGAVRAAVKCEGGYRINARASSPSRLLEDSLVSRGPAHYRGGETEQQSRKLPQYRGERRGSDHRDQEDMHTWRMTNLMTEGGAGRPDRGREPETGGSHTLGGLQGAAPGPRRVSHFICELKGGEQAVRGSVEVQGWIGNIPDEMLNGERTQL